MNLVTAGHTENCNWWKLQNSRLRTGGKPSTGFTSQGLVELSDRMKYFLFFDLNFLESLIFYYLGTHILISIVFRAISYDFQRKLKNLKMSKKNMIILFSDQNTGPSHPYFETYSRWYFGEIKLQWKRFKVWRNKSSNHNSCEDMCLFRAADWLCCRRILKTFGSADIYS